MLTSAEWRRPVIKLNSEVVVGPEVVLNPGTPLVLRCEGDGPVNWLTRLSKHKSLISKGNGSVRTFTVDRPSAEHTGTYKCEYTSGNVKGRDLFSTVHVYVKGKLRRGVSCRLFTIPVERVCWPVSLILTHPTFSTRPRQPVLDQQHIPACGEEGGGGPPAPLPADRPRGHRLGAPHGQLYLRAPRDELHSRPPQRHPYPQPPTQLQRGLCLQRQAPRGGEDLQGFLHQHHSK